MSKDRQGLKPWLMLLSILASFAILAAACGSDDDSSDDASSESETDSDASADEDAMEDEDEAMEDEDDAMEDEDADGDAMEERSINVAIVGNPIIDDIAALAPEHFTAETGITVNFTVLPEQELREITTRDVGAGGDQFDVVQIGMYETPQFGANGWLVGLNDLAACQPPTTTSMT